MLMVDGVKRLELRSEFVVGVIVEAQSRECPVVWTGPINVIDKIFEMHSPTTDVVEQKRSAILFDWLFFMPDRPFSGQS